MDLVKTQYQIEEKHHKRNRSRIIKEALDSPSGHELIKKTVKCIKDYISQKYSYVSKNVRIFEVQQRYIEDPTYLHELAINILTKVLPIEQPMPIQSVVSCISSMVPHSQEYARVVTASELLAVTAKTRAFTLIPARDSETGSIQIQSNARLDGEEKQALANIMYLPPMVAKPMIIRSNYESAQYSFDDCVILGKENSHNARQALDVLNILNQQELSLDTRMMQFVEQPNKECDTPEKVENFKRLQNSSTAVYKGILGCGNKFYNVHKFDKRGRVYSQGYHVHVQSTDYKKSLINLANKEVIEI